MSEQRGEGDRAGTSTDAGPTVIDVTPTPAPEPEHRAETPAKAHGSRIPIAALIALVVIVATSPYWAPPIASILPWGGTPAATPAPVDMPAIETKLSAVESRIAELTQAQQRAVALEPRIAQLEQRPAPAPNPRDAQALGALGDRIAALEQKISTLAAVASSQTAADATKGLQAQVQALGQKLDEQSQLLATLQNQQSQKAADTGRADAALALTMGQLRSVLATARPYAAELEAVEALAKDVPDTLAALKKLDARAQQGVPTIAMLAARFPGVVQATTPASAPAADEDWRARTWAKLKNLVRIRRVGEGQGTEPKRGDLADAEAALRSGDLASAVAAARRAGESTTPAFTSWLEDAQARLDTEATLATVDATLMKRFIAEPAGAKP